MVNYELERSQRKRSGISNGLPWFPVGDLHELLGPLVHDSLGWAVPG